MRKKIIHCRMGYGRGSYCDRFFPPGPLRDGTEWKVDATFIVRQGEG
jgi:hypothetical protein